MLRAVALASLLCGAPALLPAQTPDEQLRTAIVQGDSAAAVKALTAGASANTPGQDGNTPLMSAAMFGKPAIVRLLLAKGADPNAKSPDFEGNALNVAFSRMNGMTLLGRDDDPTPAKRAQAMAVVKALLDAGANPNIPVKIATQSMTPLMQASQAGMADLVQLLLEGGADPNVTNAGRYTALDYAVDRPPPYMSSTDADRLAAVEALLKAGAKVNRSGADKVTPIERARRSGYPAIVAALSKPSAT